MRNWLRSHLTYANIISTLCLFLLLGGGTAVALGGSNTVFTDDIANDTQPASGGNPAGGLVAADLRPSSVGTSEVALNSLGAGDLAANSVGTSEVAPDSLGLADLATDSVASGEVVGQSLTGFDIEDSSIKAVDIDATGLNADQLDGMNSTDFFSSTGGQVFGSVDVGGTLSASRFRLPMHASAPAATECDEPAEVGEIFLVDAATTLYICTTTGWIGK
jgi:hypothetical protein